MGGSRHGKDDDEQELFEDAVDTTILEAPGGPGRSPHGERQVEKGVATRSAALELTWISVSDFCLRFKMKSEKYFGA